MAREEQTEKTPMELIERAWDLAEKIRVCNFNTWNGSELHSRPMDAKIDRDGDAIHFLTDVESYKVEELEKFPQVTLSFADPGSYKFVTMTGAATILNDRAMIRELWDDSNKLWWDSAEDPRIRLITFAPDDAEIWDSPNKVVSGIKMLTAAVTGAKPRLGDHAKVSL
jgi:general stress protein 26